MRAVMASWSIGSRNETSPSLVLSPHRRPQHDAYLGREADASLLLTLWLGIAWMETVSEQPDLFPCVQVDPRTVPPSHTPYQRGSETSRDAALRAQGFVCVQGMKVYAWIVSRQERGATQKEAEVALVIGRPSLAARFNALEQRGWIRKTDQRRGGCAVYQATRTIK